LEFLCCWFDVVEAVCVGRVGAASSPPPLVALQILAARREPEVGVAPSPSPRRCRARLLRCAHLPSVLLRRALRHVSLAAPSPFAFEERWSGFLHPLSPLMGRKNASSFALSVGLRFGDSQCPWRCIYAFALCCWTQSYGIQIKCELFLWKNIVQM
jgi:hypothetical protein